MVVLLVTGRYLVFQSFVKIQKTQFRELTLEKQGTNVQVLLLTCEQLYKDTGGMEWKEGNRELVIGGIYHEVISVCRKGAGFQVKIIKDEAENRLFSDFFNKTGKGKDLANLLLLTNGLFFFPPAQLVISPLQSGPGMAAPALLCKIKKGYLSGDMRPPALYC